MSNRDYIPPLNFDFLTPYFDIVCEVFALGSQFKRLVIDELHLQTGEQLLDIGCGTGTLIVEAKKTYPSLTVIGVDPDNKSLAIARKKIEREGLKIELIQTGAQKLPFPSRSFDAITSTLVFHHLPTEIKKQALKEVYRVLKNDGRFLLADIGMPQHIGRTLGYKLVELLHLPEAETMQDNIKGRLPQIVKEAGFQVKEIRPEFGGKQFLLSTKR